MSKELKMMLHDLLVASDELSDALANDIFTDAHEKRQLVSAAEAAVQEVDNTIRTARTLVEKLYPKEQWREQVAIGNTDIGYAGWAMNKLKYGLE